MFARSKFLAALTLLLALGAVAQAAVDWKIVKIGGREYLSADNIAEFYGLPTGVPPRPKPLRLAHSHAPRRFHLDRRRALLHGVCNVAC